MINFINSFSNNEFKPAQSQTDKLAEFEALKLGWLICWGMEIFDSYTTYANAAPNPVAGPGTFTYNGIDVTPWADAAQSAGNVDYAILTTKWNRGFHIYPSKTVLNGGSQFTGKDSYNASIDLPQYEPYGVNNPGLATQQTIIDQFITSFKALGIKTGFYYNVGKDLNNRGGFSSIEASGFDGTGNYIDYWNAFKSKGLDYAKSQYPALTGDYAQFYRLYIEYVKQELTYLITGYEIDYIWLDAVSWYPRADLYELYTHIKGLNRNVLVFHNPPPEGGTMYPDGTMTDPPFIVSDNEIYLYQGTYPAADIFSYEEVRIPTAASEKAALTPHNGVNYYIPKEVSANSWQSGIYGWESGKSIRTDLQTLYNTVSGDGMRLMLSMSPKPDGTLDTTQINALSAITT
jgi:hypothetical protein